MVAFIYLIVHIYLLCKSLFLHCITSYLGRVWWHSSHFSTQFFFIDLWCTDFVDVNVFFVLFLVCFFKLLNFLVVQLQCMTHYYHTLYLMMSFRCSTLARFKVYLANWKWPFGSSICLKNRCLDLETGRSPLSLKSQFENQKNSIPYGGMKHKFFIIAMLLMF